MDDLKRQHILQQIAAIPAMERGKLSRYGRARARGAASPYYKLQFWKAGKNHTRYVPSEQVSAVEAALAGFAQYEQLTQQYAELMIAETRQNIERGKKKPGARAMGPVRDKNSEGLSSWFQSQCMGGGVNSIAQLETLVHTAVVKSANKLVGFLLQDAANNIDARYEPKPGEVCKGRKAFRIQMTYGRFEFQRNYYYDADRQQGHYPVDTVLGLENANKITSSDPEFDLEQFEGVPESDHKIQRVA